MYAMPQFYADYKGQLDTKTFNKVFDTFFGLAAKFVVKGGYLHTPIGQFHIRRENTNRLYVDFGKLRNRDQHEHIYRDRNYIDKIIFTPKGYTDYWKNYMFRPVYETARNITRFEDIRTFKIKADAIQHNLR